MAEGTIRFKTVVDNTALKKGLDEVKKKINDTKNVSVKSNEILQKAMSGVAVDFNKAFAEIDKGVGIHQTEIAKLRGEYESLGKQMVGKSLQGEGGAMSRRRTEISQEIALRKRLVAEFGACADALQKEEQKAKTNAQATTTLRTQIMQLKEEMASLRMKGISEQSAEYTKLKNRLGELQDIYGDISTQGKILSNDQASFQGVISGLQGVTGAFSVATGAMTLFAGANEDVQRAMAKVSAIMNITMGLQAISQTLNKDSAFSLVTLTKIKEWWAGVTAKATATQTAENVAVAQGTTANLTLAGAIRIVGQALKSIPVLGWVIAGITALAGAVYYFHETSKTAKDVVSDLSDEIMKLASEPIGEFLKLQNQFNSLNGSIDKQTAFIEQNRKAFKKLGFEINSVSEAQKLLNQNSEKFISLQIAKAKVKALEESEAYKESISEIVELELERAETIDSIRNSSIIRDDIKDRQIDRYNAYYNAKINEEKKGFEKYLNVANEFKREADRLSKDIGAVSDVQQGSKVFDKDKNKAQELIKEQERLIRLKKSLKQFQDKPNILVDTKQIEAELKKTKERVALLGKEVTQYDRLQQKLKNLQDERKKLEDTKDLQANAREIRKVEKQLSKWAINKESTQKTSNKTAVSRTDIKAQQEKEAEALLKAQRQKERILIEAEKEGYEKEKALLQWRHKERMAEIEAHKKEYIEQNKALGQGGELTSKQKQVITIETEIAEVQHAQDSKALFNDYLKEYEDFTAQRLAVESKYTDLHRAIQEKRFNEDDTLNKEAQARALAQLEESKAKELQTIQKQALSKYKLLDLSEGKGSNFIQDELKKVLPLFTELSSLSFAELQKAKTALKEIKLDPNVVKELEKAGVNTKELSKQLAELKKNSEGQINTKLFSKLGERAEQLGSAIAGIGGQIAKLKGAEDVGGGIAKVGEILGQVGSIASSFASGDIFGGVVKTLGAITKGIVDWINAEEKAEQERIKRQQEYNKALRESRREMRLFNIEQLKYKQRNIFNVDEPLKKARSSVETYKAYMQEIKNAEHKLLNTDAYLVDIKVKRNESKKWWQVWKSDFVNENVMAKLNRKYGEVINKDTLQINAQLLEDIKVGHTTEEVKDLVEQLKEVRDKALESREAMRRSFGEVVGGLGAKLQNALAKGLNGGGMQEALQDFKRDVGAVIEELGLKAIENAIYGKMFDKLEEDLIATEGDTEKSNALLLDFADEVIKKREVADRMVQQLNKDLVQKGLKRDNQGDTQANTLQGAVKGVTEETASLVAGQLNAIRINQTEATNVLRNQLISLKGIEQNTAPIKEIANTLKNLPSSKASSQKEPPSFEAVDTNTLRSAGLGD